MFPIKIKLRIVTSTLYPHRYHLTFLKLIGDVSTNKFLCKIILIKATLAFV